MMPHDAHAATVGRASERIRAPTVPVPRSHTGLTTSTEGDVRDLR
jgi:hypothetical protein